MNEQRKIRRRFALALLALLLLNGCQVLGTRRQPPPSPLPLRDLLIDAATYPSGWKQEDIVDDDRADEVENLTISFRNPTKNSPVSIHEILRYASQYEAQQDFDQILQQERENDSSLVPIPQLTYASHTAQRTSLLCMKRDSDRVDEHRLCIAMAQYGPYISVFSAPINKRFMNYANFSRILGVIDSKMASVANAY